MTTRASHRCSICGKVETWSDSWCWFGSWLEEDSAIELCSNACRVEFERRGRRITLHDAWDAL